MTENLKPCPICGQDTTGRGLECFDKELSSCPFCGSEYVSLFKIPSEWGVNFIAGCEECGARTRECISHTEAIEVWNERNAHAPKTQDMPLVKKVIFDDWPEAYESMKRNALAMLQMSEDALRIGNPDEDERDVLQRIRRRCQGVIDALNIA